MPEIRLIPLSLINEPEIAARMEMDEEKMEELKQSLMEIGQTDEIKVFPKDNGRFEIIDGHRRFLAIRDLQWPEISAKVYAPGEADTETLKLHAFIREDLTPAEEALFYEQICERDGMDIDALCAKVKRTRAYVDARFALLRGDRDVFNAVASRKIGFGVGLELNKIPQELVRRDFLYHATTGGWTVAMARRAVEQNRMAQNPVMEGTAVAPQAEPSAVPPPPDLKCWICGGDLLQHMMVYKRGHDFCYAKVEQGIQQGA